MKQERSCVQEFVPEKHHIVNKNQIHSLRKKENRIVMKMMKQKIKPMQNKVKDKRRKPTNIRKKLNHIMKMMQVMTKISHLKAAHLRSKSQKETFLMMTCEQPIYNVQQFILLFLLPNILFMNYFQYICLIPNFNEIFKIYMYYIHTYCGVPKYFPIL
ncbi:Hypothetical_protein [Hexamita inflata]|uniref:Hypothetical_protein n=1 Tax=Hexamita inflata TaxID=28002 RepID=A0AA86U3W5_9EUKA|nr:Hypothetical protein HINF_LOCUS17553 [Hexamita inflata]